MSSVARPFADPGALAQVIAEASDDVIFAKDLEGRYQFANPAMLATVGCSLEQVLGRRDDQVMADPVADRRLMENDRAVLAAGRVTEVEESVPLPDGSLRHIDAAVDPAGTGHLAIDVRALLPSGGVRWLHIRLQVTFALVDGRLQPDRGICAARDVTAQMVAEEALREADRRKDEFIATLAHELRNPLAPIRTGLELLRAPAT